MTGKVRRENILEELKQATGPINATKLAEMNGVTRQIIVADIALLRAAGNNIRAEHKGYVLDRNANELRKQIVCRHGKEHTTEELYIIVDNGGKVIDVQVEHTIYGMISGNLDISSRYDVDQFVEDLRKTGATPLSDLTDGIHIHTIVVKDEASFDRICKKLNELGVLIND